MHVRLENDPYDNRYILNPAQRLVIEPDFGTDGEDYEVLMAGVVGCIAANGLVLEVGTRLGGGLATIVNVLLQTEQSRPVVSVDPYGGLPYDAADDRIGETLDYTNSMMHDAMSNIHLACVGTGVDFTFINLTDTDFMDLYRDGVPIYQGGERRVWNEYALVHFDGPHSTYAVMQEAAFFNARTGVESVFVFDDVASYDHDSVERYLFNRGWTSLSESASKMAYKRTTGAEDL